MSDRKAELERKKAKLQAIREEKERRRREKEQKDVEEATVRAAGADKDHRKELDAMLSSLGVAPVSDVLSSLSSMNSLTPEQSANATPDASLQPSSINSAQSISARKKNRELTIVSVAHTNIPPKEPVVYTKQTQTIQTSHTSHDGYFETDWWRPRKGGSAPNYLCMFCLLFITFPIIVVQQYIIEVDTWLSIFIKEKCRIKSENILICINFY